ncbi:unannotated protein [freshwater metagenome]|uniref:Unannotated protein n=1 Tax=freshwater metagenome TaxID=449393 RepID=A0A6J7AV56_9ZZZZ
MCFIKENIGAKLIEEFNVENVCWESDYPHSDSTWPYGPEELLKSLDGFSDANINKISHENAMKHYSFDPFVHRSKEKCTAAALRAESPEVDTVTHAGRPADERDLESWRAITGTRR